MRSNHAPTFFCTFSVPLEFQMDTFFPGSFHTQWGNFSLSFSHVSLVIELYQKYIGVWIPSTLCKATLSKSLESKCKDELIVFLFYYRINLICIVKNADNRISCYLFCSPIVELQLISSSLPFNMTGKCGWSL